MPTGVSPSANSSRSTGTTRCPAASDVVERRRGSWWSSASSSAGGLPDGRRASGSTSKQECAPVWQAGPSCSTWTSSVSPSQSSAAPRTYCALPLVSPLRQYSWRLRDQKVTRPSVSVRRSASRVHVAEHEHLAGVVLLDDRRAAGRPASNTARSRPPRRPSTPSARRSSHDSPHRPQRGLDVADRQLAVVEHGCGEHGVGAGRDRRREVARPRRRRRWRSPARVLSSRMAATSSRSKPCFVPSASIELTSSSPAPRSIASRAQSSASRSVSVRPPCVVTTKPTRCARLRFTSSESTSTCAPNRSAISSIERRAGDRGAVDADLVGAAARAGARRRRASARRRRR